MSEAARSTEEEPLHVPDQLAEVRPPAPRRTGQHWFLFLLACAVGFAPIFAGFYVGVGSAAQSVKSDSLMPLWAGAVGALLAAACLALLIFGVYAVTEARIGLLWAALLLSVAAWPLVALALFVVAHEAPAQPLSVRLCSDTSVGDLNSGNCVWTTEKASG